MNDIRKGQVPAKLSRDAFRAHFERSFFDASFSVERDAITRLEEIAWNNYQGSRKAPNTRKAGTEFSNPDYDLSLEWLDARARIRRAAKIQADAGATSRVLVICASARNDGTCPGEMSKSYRLSTLAADTLRTAGIEVDLLDMSLLASEYGRKIHPCKGCVSTAMPLCHWPCSCYPNHSLGQSDDWMNEIYERWTAAHGILIVTPVYWYQVPATLKLMIDRLVCADGGNPDPTSTAGKDPAKAKDLELEGWPYPKHLADRVYAIVVHGDVAGTESVRRALSDWLDWMGMIAAGPMSRLDRMIGYYEPYATSHQSLDGDTAVQEEVRNAARALAAGVAEKRAGRLRSPDAGLDSPRPK
ncbi:MAG: NADPH-dependent reductase [Betaproteobacteria bacterium]|nr:NADPH-dependent reductase [Betaproteobacteria bacterium]